MKRVLAALLLCTLGCSRSSNPAAPIGDSMIAGPYVATLLESEEFRIPEVPHRPENDRYRLALVLHTLDGKTRRIVPIKGGLRSTDFIHGARMIADDGQRLWFHAHESMSYDYGTGKLTSAPSPHHRSLRTPAPKDFRGPAGTLCAACKRPKLLLKAPDGDALRLTGPDSVLVLHRSDRVVFGTELLSRSTTDGKLLWTADTSLLDVDQILPTSTHTVFVGREPAPKPDAFRPPVLVIVDNQSGTFTTHSLSTLP